MRARPGFVLATLLPVAAILATNCSEAPFEPQFRVPETGFLRVITSTTGDDLDSDGYQVAIGPIPTLPGTGRDDRIGANDTLVIGPLAARTYLVTVSGAAANCNLAARGKEVPIVAADTFDLLVSGTCTALGTLVVTVETSGVDPDPDGYTLTATVWGFWVDTTTANDDTLMVKVIQGRYVVTLQDVEGNCDVAGANPMVVEVASGGTTAAAFRVTCTPVTRLAYALHGTMIYTIDSNGTGGPRLLGDGVVSDGDPAWSPDGRRIAFTSQNTGASDIYVMDADGPNRVRLTTHDAADYNPSWSPDGARIAFVSDRDGNAEIYAMSADGSNQVRLTNHGAIDSDPAWSPDGRSIAISSNRDGNAEIYVMNADGTAQTRFTSHVGDDVRPAWSPQGTVIAFERQCGDPGECIPMILTMSATGSVPVEITRGSAPAWSPNGRKIAYTSHRCIYDSSYPYYYVPGCEVSGIRIVALDGKGDVGVVNGPTIAPAWRW